MELAKAAYAKDAANPLFQDTLGWVRYKLDDPEGARDLIEMAVIKAKGPESFYHLAVLSKYVDDDIEVARDNIEEALRRLNEIPSPGYVTRQLKANAVKLAKSVGASLRPGPRE